MSQLLEKQQTFCLLVARLIDHAFRNGYKFKFGEAYRSPEEAERLAKLGIGIKDSNHCKDLAIDLPAFKDGKYLTMTEDYKELGDYWESLSTPGFQCRWGGHFHDSHGKPKPDGNHFEMVP